MNAKSCIFQHLPPSVWEMVQQYGPTIYEPNSQVVKYGRSIDVCVIPSAEKVAVVVETYFPYLPEVAQHEKFCATYEFKNHVAQNNFSPHPHRKKGALIEEYQTQSAELELKHSLEQMRNLRSLSDELKNRELSSEQRKAIENRAEKVIFNNYYLYPRHAELLRTLNEKLRTPRPLSLVLSKMELS